MIFSYTLIDCFHNVCPRQAYERWWLKLKVADTPELLEGHRVHKALETRLLFDTALGPDLAHMEPTCGAIDRRGIPQLELKLGVDRELGESGFFDSDTYIRSVLDLLLYTAERKSGIIIDWKTGKNREAQKEPLQLMIFAAQVFARSPETESLTATNIYTKDGKPGTAHTFKRSELPELWRTILPLIHEIEQAEMDNKFPERPSPLCGWCPVVKCQHNRNRDAAT